MFEYAKSSPVCPFCGASWEQGSCKECGYDEQKAAELSKSKHTVEPKAEPPARPTASETKVSDIEAELLNKLNAGEYESFVGVFSEYLETKYPTDDGETHAERAGRLKECIHYAKIVAWIKDNYLQAASDKTKALPDRLILLEHILQAKILLERRAMAPELETLLKQPLFPLYVLTNRYDFLALRAELFSILTQLNHANNITQKQLTGAYFDNAMTLADKLASILGTGTNPEVYARVVASYKKHFTLKS